MLVSVRYVPICEHFSSGPAQLVMLGVIDLEDEEAEVRNVVQRIPCPNYATSEKVNDIGLLKLDHSVTFKSTIRPACLNTDENMMEQLVSACGFGKLSYGNSFNRQIIKFLFIILDSERGSKRLMKVPLLIYNNNLCLSNMPHQKLINSMICAGYLPGGKDTCQGDSGGPLQTVLEKPYCMYSLVGVTSYGKFCGFKNSPAVYTNVALYVPWIESIVWR